MITTQNSEGLPTLQEQAAFFDEWNSKYRTQGFEDIEPESKARGTRVLELLQALPLSRPSILEVGCGTGWLAERLCHVGPTTGLDLSERAIELARRRELDATFIAGDFYQLDLGREAFDVIVSLDTIAGVPDQAGFLRKVGSLLKSGGYLLLTVQNKFVYERRSDIGRPRWGQIRKWLSRRQLHQLLAADFRVLASTTVLPKGDQGILRVANSHKVNHVLRLLFSECTITRAKERLGLGNSRVILAQRRSH
jgi:2-polyprenyl-3-methyl-5-hydroxy-6-metoxy-1,4-benzoquinol methylase